MPEIALKYGCNPNQTPARVVMSGDGPLRVVHGAPSYINVLDGLRGWQLVRDLTRATGKAAAASFKHVSPAGAAVSATLDAGFCAAHGYDTDPASLSPVAAAYARARSSDRSASFGDFVAVSERVDRSLAMLLKTEVSDGIIAPGYDDHALTVLSGKKGGKYVVLAMDERYEPPAVEARTDFGVTLEQRRDDRLADASAFANVVTKAKQLPGEVVETLVVATLTIKHTQSNSIGVALGGHAIGIGAGQQSRIACTRLACDKADRWRLKSHPRAAGLRFVGGLPKAERVNAVESFVRWHELNDDERAAVQRVVASTVEPLSERERADWLSGHADTSGGGGGLVLSSDAFIPFRDNLDRAAASGVGYVAQAGGSARDADVIAAADQHGMVMCMTGQRWFLH